MRYLRHAALAAAGFALLGATSGRRTASAQADGRQPLVVTAGQRAMMLAQMRGFLQSVNGVLVSTAAGDRAAARAAAAAAGMAVMHERHMSMMADSSPPGGARPRMGMIGDTARGARGVQPRMGMMRDSARMRGGPPGMGMGGMGRDSMPMAMGGMGGMGMGRAMPEAFMRLAHATHAGFDSLATAIGAGAGADTVMARLASLTSNCVGCHATYRLETR